MRTAAFYGNSLVLAGIQAGLEQCAGLRVLTIDATQPGAGERLSELHPDVVVFDLAAACPVSSIALWKAQPNLLLIGIDLAADRALVLSGQSPRVLAVDDLVALIGVFASERR
jgi:hypothetical protein